MPRTIEIEPLKKHTLHLYSGDFEKLASFYPELGGSVAVRRIVRSQLKRLEAQIDPVPIQENLDV